MAQGLQCWDADGKLIFDSSVQTTYVLGQGSTGEGNGSLPYDDRLLGHEDSFWVAMITTSEIREDSVYAIVAYTPKFSVKNGILSWVDNTGAEAYSSRDSFGLNYITGVAPKNRQFIYGVY